MKIATKIIQNVVRLLAVILIVLGFMFWAHQGVKYIPIHVGIGIVFVVLLWTLSVIAFFARVKPMLVIAGVVWGLLVLWFGSMMRSGAMAAVFPGHLYEIARVLHFFIGLAAIGFAEVLGKRIKLSASR